MLSAALTTKLLPLRMRTLLDGDGTALLVHTPALHKLAGFDRRLASRGRLVLPTTMAVVDPATAELILPVQAIDGSVPSGRLPISRIIPRRSDDDLLEGAAPLLALARAVPRHPGQRLQAALTQIDQLTRDHADLVTICTQDEIDAIVEGLATARSA
jgi:hypothetical protein